MIILQLEPLSKRKKWSWSYWKRKRRQKRGICKEHPETEVSKEYKVLQLPCDMEETKILGRQWFLFCIKMIKEKYPEELLYYEELVCCKFGLAEYRKRWITWYLLWDEVWEEFLAHYYLEEKQLEVVLCDTMDEKAYLLFRILFSSARKIQVVTGCKERWMQLQECMYEEEGELFEIMELLPEDMEGKVLVDVDGLYLYKYGVLSEKNRIIAIGICRGQREYLQYRIKAGNVVVGMEQTIAGEIVDNKFAAVYMQSMVWKIRQLAETKEEIVGREDIGKLLEEYRWHLRQLEVM